MSIESIAARNFDFGIEKENIIGSWKSDHYKITLFISNIHSNKIKAFVENLPLGTFSYYNSKQIKCGILGFIPHQIFIQSIRECDRETIEYDFKAVYYSHTPFTHEVWFFESQSEVTSDAEKKWFQECVKSTENFQPLLSHLEKVVAVQKKIGNNPKNLAVVVSQLQKELGMHRNF